MNSCKYTLIIILIPLTIQYMLNEKYCYDYLYTYDNIIIVLKYYK